MRRSVRGSQRERDVGKVLGVGNSIACVHASCVNMLLRALEPKRKHCCVAQVALDAMNRYVTRRSHLLSFAISKCFSSGTTGGELSDDKE